MRRIWGDADVILLVFAGSAAEFALNKAVDWLFFTGKLPADPIGRLFSTVQYAQQIVFADEQRARQAVGRMASIHAGVEASRGYAIPDWAYRDVLYMLIDYSERAYTLLHRPLTQPERAELFDVFRRVGDGMGVPDLPVNYTDWQLDRQAHLANDLERSSYTDTLFRRYHEEIGDWRYSLLRQAQSLLVPDRVARLLDLPERPLLANLLWIYPTARALGLRALVQRALLPATYLARIQALERTP
ncbi:oxygenase MpaB family protein [Fibrella forsythiae]|uniref:oxygenase MpaB family protein n=1 Tax=Fibrella forsythiae TaxID=2817061 RepID=UPI00286DF958|nr:oxygenase MpaB family protein [Fibrella forsythiae]